MNDISQLSHDLDKNKRECKAIIETPKGRRNKFKYESDSGLFSLSNLLPEGFSFPFDFGFIPSTVAEDGDPLDVIVLMDEPAHVGCLLKIRLIGVVKVVQTEDGKRTPNDRLVAVSTRSFEYESIHSVSELRASLMEQISEFIGLYNKNSAKEDEVTGTAGPDEAVDLLERAAQRFEKKK
ncbi:MAG: inorganic diphosphatase [Bryobacteraceae bacterium]